MSSGFCTVCDGFCNVGILNYCVVCNERAVRGVLFRNLIQVLKVLKCICQFASLSIAVLFLKVKLG